MRQCSRCGYVGSDEFKYCPMCGKKLVENEVWRSIE